MIRSIFKSGRGVDDRGVLERPPFRSIYFVVTSVMGLGCMALASYIFHRYSRYLPSGVIIAMVAALGLQVFYQAFWVFRLVPMIREFYSIASDDNLAPESPLGSAIEATVSRFVDKLFLSYGITLGILAVIEWLLSLRHPA